MNLCILIIINIFINISANFIKEILSSFSKMNDKLVNLHESIFLLELMVALNEKYIPKFGNSVLDIYNQINQYEFVISSIRFRFTET